jgi:hypothetical protein
MANLFNLLHSYNRYLVLAALLYVLYRSISGWLGKKPFEKADNTASVALLGLTHLQLFIGLIQYFGTTTWFSVARNNFSGAMKDSWLRYFTIEHLTGMLLAAVFIQLGRTLSKKATDDASKHRKLAIYTAIGAVIIIGTLASKGILIGTAAAAMQH